MHVVALPLSHQNNLVLMQNPAKSCRLYRKAKQTTSSIRTRRSTTLGQAAGTGVPAMECCVLCLSSPRLRRTCRSVVAPLVSLQTQLFCLRLQQCASFDPGCRDLWVDRRPPAVLPPAGSRVKLFVAAAPPVPQQACNVAPGRCLIGLSHDPVSGSTSCTSRSHRPITARLQPGNVANVDLGLVELARAQSTQGIVHELSAAQREGRRQSGKLSACCMQGDGSGNSA
jgi:hypothetical protein